MAIRFGGRFSPGADQPQIPARAVPGKLRHRLEGRTTWIRAAAYALSLDPARVATIPYAVLRDPGGRVWSALNLLSSVHTLESADETWQVEACVVEPALDDDAVHVVVKTRSTAWTEHELTLVCRPDALEVSVRVRGRGRLADVLLLGDLNLRS